VSKERNTKSSGKKVSLRSLLIAGAGGVSAIGAGLGLFAPTALSAVQASAPLEVELRNFEFPLDTTDADPFWLDGNSLVGDSGDATQAVSAAAAVGGADPVQIPAAGAIGREKTLWLLDHEAASLL